jgi:hypothetical protein
MSAVTNAAPPRLGLGPDSQSRRHSRTTGKHALLPLIVGVAVAVAAVGVTAYSWDSTQVQSSQVNTRSAPLEPDSPELVTASGISNGPGGCSGPGPGRTEYCYTFDMFFVASLGAITELDLASVEYPSTAVVGFSIQSSTLPYANLSFQNVTLLNPAGSILATYSSGVGWNAFAGGTLPISLWSNQTCVINVGTAPANGDMLWMEEGPWGRSGAELAPGVTGAPSFA